MPNFFMRDRTVERFIRKWDYYFAYCEAAFEERHIGDLQLVLAKGAARGLIGMPAAVSYASEPAR